MSNPFTTKDPLFDIINQVVLGEKKLTDAEMKKREEIVLAIKRENPDMEKSRAYAIATAKAKKVAEEVNLQEITTKSGADVDRNLDDHDPDEHGDIPDRKPDHELETHGGLTLHVHHVKDSKGKTKHTIINHVNDPAGGGTFVVKGHAHPKHILSSYNRAEREDMDEEVEQIDEVGNTEKGQIDLRKYKEKAKKDMGDAGEKLWYKSVTDKDIKGKWALAVQRDKRRKGIQRADARIKKQEVNLDEQLENFWEAYTTMFNEAEDQQQNILLRAMAKDPSDLMKMKRAIKMGDKALTNPALRQEILAMLDKMMHLTTADPSLLQRTRMGFQKAKTMKMPEEVQLEAIGAKDKQDEGEYGYEGDMAMSQLRTIIRNCQEMMKVLDKETDMPEWVQSKITLATDYLQTANDYLMSELEEETDEKEVGKEIKAARLKKDSSEFMSKSSLYSAGARDVAKHLGKKDDEKYGEAMRKVKDTPVSKFVASRKGDGKVRTEAVGSTPMNPSYRKIPDTEAKDAPFEGGREVKSSKSAAERVKKIAKGMEKLNTPKDKK